MCLRVSLCVCVCVCMYLGGVGLVGGCRLGVVLSDCLHVGTVIPIGRHRWSLEHKKGM